MFTIVFWLDLEGGFSETGEWNNPVFDLKKLKGLK
jgi:hypothetical protein